MDDDDKGFFILVLGIIAAVLMVVLWWALRNNNLQSVAAPELEAVAESIAEEPVDDAAAEPPAAEPAATPEPEPTSTPEPEPTATPVPAPVLPSTVAEIIGGDTNLSGLAGALAANGLDDALSGEGPFTVLAPSNAALDAVDPAAAERLLSETNAVDTLTYHVIPGSFTAEDLTELARGARGGAVATTLQGDDVFITLDGENLVINGTTTVTAADALANNGVVHTIDNVLVPQEQSLNLIVALAPIQFESGSAQLTPDSELTLDQVIAALENNDAEVAVEGHTDAQGDDAFNLALSQDRARAVVNYLVAGGIAEDRLTPEGFGETEPIADNETEEGRAENRRIEFEVIG